MMVEAGDIINVDGILIEAYDLKVNESNLISGRENVPKQAPDRDSYYVDCFIYSGTQIMVGQVRHILLQNEIHLMFFFYIYFKREK